MTRIHSVLAIGAAVLGLAAAGADGRTSVDVAGLASEIQTERDHVEAPELADRLMRQDASLRILDLRSKADYDQFHIPTAQLSTLDALTTASLPPNASIVLYSEGGTHSAQAWMLLRLRGYRDVRFLREGVYEWLARVMEPRLAVDANEAEKKDFARAEAQSRFFGGLPRSGVARAEVPTGYWTEELAGLLRELPGPTASSEQASGVARGSQSSAGTSMIANIRRRGC